MSALRKPRTFDSDHIDAHLDECGINFYVMPFDFTDLKAARRLRDWLNKAITWMEYKQGKV